MKKHLLFLSALLLSVTALFAQAPQKMSYQAVVRNTNNTLVTNQSVSAKISILQGGVNGTPVYVETHFVTTNANGLLTLEVGNGTAVSGSMATVNWANGPFFLKSEIDPDGGINYSIEGTQQLLSVPYALYAEKAGNVPAFGIVPVDSGYVISVVQPGGTPQTYFLPTGGQGPAGPAGNDGLSAYQLWLNAGNTGSEADFLASLVGTPGNDGNDGQDGVGIDSVAKTGSVANVDTYTIYYSNHTTTTYTVTNGVDGTPGDPGTPGFSPTITVDTGAAGMVLTITDVNGTNQYLIPTGGGSSSGGTIVQQQVNWNETNPASVTYILNKPSLATVATSGNYNDLLNKPTIPTNISQLNNDAGYLTGQEVTNLNNNVSNLSNSVSNMSNSVNNLQNSIDTMQNNISNLQQTVANIPAPVQSNWNETNTASPAYIQNKPTIPTVPTNVSAFQNDAGYITNAAVPTFNVTQTDTGYVLTMTPPGGNAQQYVLRNGVDGENGAAGNGISYVTGPVTSGNVDTYTIHYTNGTTSNFTVTNGTNGQNGLSPTINVTTGDAGTVLTITDATGTHQHTIPNSSSSGGTIVQQQVNWNETNPSSVSYILNKPNLATVATSGNYNDLTNKPTIPTVPSNVSAFQNDAGYISSQNIQQYLPEVPAQVNADWNATSGVAQILHKPTLATVATTGSYNDLTNKPTIPTQVKSDWNVLDTSSAAYIKNKPIIPAAQVNADWTATSGVAQILHKPTLATVATSGSYNDLTNKPTIPAAQVQANWNETNTSSMAFIKNKPTIPAEQVQANWNETNTSSKAFIKNKPTIPAAQVNADWNATSGVAQILHKPTLATVATSGSYNDLTNKPTIPTQVKSDWAVYDTASLAYIKNKPTVYSYNDIQNMINSSLGALNNRIDSLQSALNAAQQAEQQNNNLTFVCGTSKMYDYEGNAYNTVKIGNQCWMKENLRTTHYSDGTSIDPVYQPSSGHDHRDGNAPAYSTGTMNGKTFFMYNMPAAFHGLPSAVIDMDDYYEQGEEEGAPLQGICPNGWHLPSYSDWYYLTSELSWGSNPMICGNNSDNIAKALADNNTSSWNTSTIECAIGNNIAANNASGFSAIGYGFSFYIPQNGGYSSGTLNPKQSTAFWSSSPYIEYGEMQNPIPTDSVYCIELNYLNPNVLSHYNNKQYLLFVRCVRDAAEGTVQQMQEQIDNLQQQLDAQGSKPYVYISSTSYSEASNSIIVNATASSSGEVLLAKGICWSTTENPTVSNNYVLSTSTSNSYTCNINNMNYGTRYYIRAFATNSNGTSYSDQRYESAGVDLGGNQYVVPANYSTTITISEAIDTGSVWVYDAGGPNGSYSNDCDGYLVIKPGNSAKKVKLMSGTYDTESCCDYIQIYDGTNTTATTGYVSQYKGSGSVTAYTSTASDGSLTIRFRSDYSVNKTGFSLRFAMVGACDGETTVTDYQNNSYSIKEYGTQCWMTQNLRSTKFSNGTSITSGGSGTSSAGIPNANTSESSPYYYRNTNFSISDYGYYYNYSAVESSNHLCPTGWHIPSTAEFGTLFSYLRGSSSNWCNTTDNTSIAKAIASTTGWSSSTYTCAIGNNQTTNNRSGFNLFPAGIFRNASTTQEKYFQLPGSSSYVWTQTYTNPVNITNGTSTLSTGLLINGVGSKADAASVRCVKD